MTSPIVSVRAFNITRESGIVEGNIEHMRVLQSQVPMSVYCDDVATSIVVARAAAAWECEIGFPLFVVIGAPGIEPDVYIDTTTVTPPGVEARLDVATGELSRCVVSVDTGWPDEELEADLYRKLGLCVGLK